LRSTFISRIDNTVAWSEVTEQPFTFLLKNGEIVQRTYTLPINFAQRAGLTTLLNEEAVILSRYNFSPDNVAHIAIEYYNYDTVQDDESRASRRSASIEISKPDEITSLLNEMKKDILANNRASHNVDGRSYQDGFLQAYVVYDNRWHQYFSFNSYENVDNWLEARGLIPEFN
jgi:hypothetical protein